MHLRRAVATYTASYMTHTTLGTCEARTSAPPSVVISPELENWSSRTEAEQRGSAENAPPRLASIPSRTAHQNSNTALPPYVIGEVSVAISRKNTFATPSTESANGLP